MPIDKNTQLPITQISGLDINYTNSNSTLTVPRVTNVERDNLVNIITETEPQGTVKTSTIIFNVDEDAFQGKSKAGWVNFAGNAPAANTVLYDDTGIAAGANTISIFSDNKGTTIQGSGVAIARVPAAKNENAEVTQLSNIGVLQFGNSTSTLDHASILLNGSSAINLQENQGNTATIISSGLPQGSSSPSATLEINTNEGALLVSRLTTTERDAFVSPQDGYICYNTTTKKLNFRQNGKWLEYSDSNNGYLPTKSISADYFATNDDCVIYVQGSELHIPINIYLPNTTPGKLWIIKDGRDNASQYPITVYPELVIRPYTINTDSGYLWLIGHEGDVGYDIINISSTNTGNVVGPTSSVNNSVAVFDGVTGKIIKDSGGNLQGIHTISNSNKNINISESITVQHYFTTSTIKVYVPGADITGSSGYIGLNCTNASGSASGSIDFVGDTGGIQSIVFNNSGGGLGLPSNIAVVGYVLTATGTLSSSWQPKNALSTNKIVSEQNNNITFEDLTKVYTNKISKHIIVYLPNIDSLHDGEIKIIKDAGNNASFKNIIIKSFNSQLIENDNKDYIINTNNGFVQFVVDKEENNWLIIAKG